MKLIEELKATAALASLAEDTYLAKKLNKSIAPLEA